MSIFEKFNKNIDTKALMEEVKKAGENNDFPEIPHGTYVVRVDKMELKESKAGNPMLTVQFVIADGEFKKQRIFMHQVLTTGFGIYKANEFLKSLDTDQEIEFDGNFEDYNNLILDIHEEIDGKLEYELEYGEDKKGYKTFEITEVYDI